MKKLLVPTDFSKPAQNAVKTAASIAKKTNAEIILLHVIEQPGEGSFNVEGEVASGGDWQTKIYTAKLIELSKIGRASCRERVCQYV